jgi:hypothetical protein
MSRNIIFELVDWLGLPRSQEITNRPYPDAFPQTSLYQRPTVSFRVVILPPQFYYWKTNIWKAPNYYTLLLPPTRWLKALSMAVRLTVSVKTNPRPAQSSTLKMEATRSSEISVNIFWTIWRCIREYNSIHSYCLVNLSSNRLTQSNLIPLFL